MKKILLAVKDQGFEGFIEEKLKDTHLVVGRLDHKDSIINIVKDKEPDILILRETLPGNQDILQIIHYLSGNHPNVRVLFIAKKREVGDKVLANLVALQVYDIVPNGTVSGEEIINLILHPNSYTDVKKYVPLPIYNEEKDEILFTSPEGGSKSSNISVGLGTLGKGVEANIPFNSKSQAEIFEEKEEVVVEKVIEEPKKQEPKKQAAKGKEKKKKEKINIFNGLKEAIESLPEVNKKAKNVNLGREIIKDPTKKIVTFLGGKNGVGTTSIAFNTAVSLADEGKKVIYLELNDKTPTSAYLYDLNNSHTGIETALTGLNKGNFRAVNEAIIKMADVKESEDKAYYRAFPKTLDLMFFSKEHLMGLSSNLDLSNPKELFLNLLFQNAYDYVIIDTDSNASNPMTYDALIYSSIVFTIVTQDISSMGYLVYQFDKFKEHGVIIEDKNFYILNMYIESKFNAKKIVDWLEAESLTIFPFIGSDFIEAAHEGLPVIKATGDKTIKESFNSIVTKIKTS